MAARVYHPGTQEVEAGGSRVQVILGYSTVWVSAGIHTGGTDSRKEKSNRKGKNAEKSFGFSEQRRKVIILTLQKVRMGLREAVRQMHTVS